MTVVRDRPHFFVDRSLGRVRVPNGLRAAGWDLTTLAEHYGIPADEAVDDVAWLTVAGAHGWAVLMKDDRIRRRPAEATALGAARVHAFCIANANIRSSAQIELFLAHESAIFQICSTAGPSLHAISRSGMRRVDLRSA